MDRRSWPWKKKSSDKSGADRAVVVTESVYVPASAGSQGEKVKNDGYKKPSYVQISMDQVKSYEHQVKRYEDQQLVYEDQINALEDEVKDLNAQLSEAQSEMITKESMVKQHAKVAEDAVSGWEKAESEAATLKNHLESVTLLKLTAEDRASHLDDALKECMRQIRNLKEEHEQNVQNINLAKTKQWEKMKHEFDSKLANLDQELTLSAAENAAVSRSLQDRSNMLMKMSEEKSQAEAEIEILKREIYSLKYELHLVAKELEIRNEEKNMCVRSADVANKQNSEGVKKIAKLEAECQRLRGLVRKKLPGPAAVAQMKLEVDNLGRDYGETRVRWSPVKSPVKALTMISSPRSPRFSSLADFSLENVQKNQTENDLLTARLLEMEEETKMLKEALAKRTTELQSSENICAKTVSKLQSLEDQLKSNSQAQTTISQNESDPPSVTSFSRECNDDDVSVVGSWATALISELSHNRKEKSIESPQICPRDANHLENMDDFLQMEKLAYSSNDSPGTVSSLELQAVANLGSQGTQFSDTSSESNLPSLKCSLKEFEQIKLEKENMVIELSKCNENLETIKSQLQETELKLTEVKSELAAAQKLNGLSETQLKCMAESYNSLEVRAVDLQTKVNVLESKIVMLDNELEEERKNCKDTEAKCKDLQEQLRRIETIPVAEMDAKSNQREMAAAAEKLAECQETIYLLDKQLKGMRPQPGFSRSPPNQNAQNFDENEHEQVHEVDAFGLHMGTEPPTSLDHQLSPDSEATNLLRSPNSKYRVTKSSANSIFEKNTRGFSRFFSTKAK